MAVWNSTLPGIIITLLSITGQHVRFIGRVDDMFFVAKDPMLTKD